jgi:hypothetical protein
VGNESGKVECEGDKEDCPLIQVWKVFGGWEREREREKREERLDHSKARYKVRHLTTV